MINSSRFNRKINVEEKWLENSFNNCPFCDSINIKKIGLIQKNPKVYFCECADCNIGFADRQPTEEFLVEYYHNYYSGQVRSTTIIPEPLAKHLYKILSPISIRQKFSILDFGGGDGSVSLILGYILLKEGITMNVEIVLIDLFPHPLENENENINLAQYSSIDNVSENQKFDIIIASAILEHVKFPKETLQKLLLLLKTKGNIYSRTPYILPFFKLLKKAGISVDTLYPGHLFDMGNLFWKNSLHTMNCFDKYLIRRSQTSLAENSFKEGILKAMVTRLFKIPSRFLKYKYHLVGGWEVLIEKRV
jgi:2-polyprenyl-3-methyl-5-hydroxy-6-metoxy-1,4-benzoquinol methylase